MDLDAVQAIEDASEYKIRVPIRNLDLRRLYVIATPQSLQIELHSRTTIRHNNSSPFPEEVIEERFSREFKLRDEIARGSTVATIGDGCIQLTALKSLAPHQRPWSELVHFDTRPSSVAS